MDGERLRELSSLGLLLGGLDCFCGPLEFAVLLRVTVLNVLQQVGLLHVEEWTLGAGKDLGGHLHSGTCAKQRTVGGTRDLSPFHLKHCWVQIPR